ncbi:uncharacterized protein HKW66_Vig0000460 [Vigna angularis]|uniref:Uncharacterized protein n=1 Tax=Phaseolus angularis TaxID=3914 RepID=A0A8T0LCZ5_PHAAN|nr:uncharacterized protein HKW66_Vig0000460 [Vigna angularis]
MMYWIEGVVSSNLPALISIALANKHCAPLFLHHSTSKDVDRDVPPLPSRVEDKDSPSSCSYINLAPFLCLVQKNRYDKQCLHSMVGTRHTQTNLLLVEVGRPERQRSSSNVGQYIQTPIHRPYLCKSDPIQPYSPYLIVRSFLFLPLALQQHRGQKHSLFVEGVSEEYLSLLVMIGCKSLLCRDSVPEFTDPDPLPFSLPSPLPQWPQDPFLATVLLEGKGQKREASGSP